MISVIIPVRNGSKTILECLNSLSSQTQKPDEILVIDNGSTDHTLPLVKQWMLTHPGLHPQLLFETKKGPSAARNRGARAAKGELFVFLDADCIAPPDWLKTISHELVQTKGAIGGPCVTPLSVLAIEKYAAMSWFFKEGSDTFHFTSPFHSRFLLGANMALLKRHWEKIRGFDEALQVSEDMDLSFRLQKQGVPMKYVSRMSVTHQATSTFWKRIRRAFFHGVLQAKIAKRDFPRRLILSSFEKSWQIPFPCVVTLELSSLTKCLCLIALLGWRWPFWGITFFLILALVWETRVFYQLLRLNIPVAFRDYFLIPFGWASGRFSLEAGRLVGAIRYRVVCL